MRDEMTSKDRMKAVETAAAKVSSGQVQPDRPLSDKTQKLIDIFERLEQNYLFSGRYEDAVKAREQLAVLEMLDKANIS